MFHLYEWCARCAEKIPPEVPPLAACQAGCRRLQSLAGPAACLCAVPGRCSISMVCILFCEAPRFQPHEALARLGQASKPFSKHRLSVLRARWLAVTGRETRQTRVGHGALLMSRRPYGFNLGCLELTTECTGSPAGPLGTGGSRAARHRSGRRFGVRAQHYPLVCAPLLYWSFHVAIACATTFAGACKPSAPSRSAGA